MRYEVRDPLPATVASTPEFKVLRSIVSTDTVLVMDGFVRLKLASEHLLHDVAMFWLLVVLVCSLIAV